MDMNEGENLGIPQSPNFSSPNISSADDAPKQDLSSEPTQQAITSSDVAAMSGTDAGAVAAAAASMTEDDAPVAVSSGAITGSTQKGAQPAGAHFNFGTRRYHGSDNTRQANINDYVQLEYPEVKPRKSKKWLFVVIAIILLAGIGVGVYFLIPKGGNGTISQKTKDLYNTFANYMLYGEDKKDPIAGEYEYGSNYYYGTLEGDSEREEHLKAAKEKYDAFKKSYENDKVENEDLTQRIQKYERDLDLYYYTEKLPIIGGGAITRNYILNGKDDTTKKIDDYYSEYNNSTLDSTKDYIKEITVRIKGVLENYDSLKANNCLNTSTYTIKTECRRSNNLAYSGSMNAIDEYEKYMSGKIKEESFLRIYAYRSIFVIGKGLYGEKENN